MHPVADATLQPPSPAGETAAAAPFGMRTRCACIPNAKTDILS
jgi:hypothetical protein